MTYKINKSKCAGCGACLKVCPFGAITIGKDGKAVIDQTKCQKCGQCKDVCPFNAIEVEE
ncbi:MAG TPA: 4Fe-4S dicluster domain-containing protein [Candidatus Moranbacteria bacterium]|nr:4Fe-4S dicluster domain-containing protein [Candidatus Moranbacteria bacterium]